MKYRGTSNFSHSQPDKIGVLLTNLGTPDSPTPQALKSYLKQFLSDPRVIEVPKLIWWLILNLVILRIRPRRSAKAYKTIWTDQGSPLLLHTQSQTKALHKSLSKEYGDSVIVEFSMRYGNPSTESVLQSMMDKGVRKLVVLPLYPQYCAATTASTFDALADDFRKRRWLPELRFITHYHDKSGYIDALAKSVNDYWLTNGKPEKLVMSFHGIPQRYLDNGDPYFCECHKTARLLAKKLDISENEYLTTFQSRVGREEWLKPYTDETLKSLPEQGIKNIHVVCPGFSADCLETIEEIGVENRDYFLAAGGEKYHYIPALNSEQHHINFLHQLVKENLQGWHITSHSSDRATLAKEKGSSI